MAKFNRRDNSERSIGRAESIPNTESTGESAPQVGEKAASSLGGDTAGADVDRERVAQRAYELYLARGGADGQAVEDWLTAERELIRGRE